MRDRHGRTGFPRIAMALLLLAGAAQAGWRLEPAATGSMSAARSRHSAVRLPDGRVLVAGGLEIRALPLPGVFVLASAELFDPATGAWETLPAAMTQKRWDHAMIALPDGRVLVAGGKADFRNKSGRATNTAEVFDPAAGTFTALEEMGAPRADFVMVEMDDGRVLLVGGRSAQVFDPATDRFVASVTLRAARSALGAVAVGGGRVLVLGGEGRSAGPAVELVDTGSGVSRLLAAKLDPAVDDLRAVALPDGRVLALVGQQPTGRTVRASQVVELNTDGQGGSAARRIAAEVEFKGGLSDVAAVGLGPLVFFAGGEADLGGTDVISPTAYLLDARSERFVAQAALVQPRDDFGAAELLPDAFGVRHVLLAGGLAPDPDFEELPQRECEIVAILPTADPPGPETLSRSGLGELGR